MKKLLMFFGVLLSLGGTSTAFSQSPQELLTGRWLLVGSSGGRTGEGHPIKSKTVIEFTSGYTYKRYEQDSLKFMKPYSIIKSKSIFERDSVSLIKIDGGFISLYSFSVDNDKLGLSEECYDCFSRIYRRLPPMSNQTKN